MVEKFSDYEGGFLSDEGEFEFEITTAELKDSKSGTLMWEFEAKAPEGSTRIWHSLDPKARWSLNNLIKACLQLSKEEIKTFELDYTLIGQQLVGKHFIGKVELQTYNKAIKVPNDDGTFRDDVEVKESYKIVAYAAVE